MKKILLLIILVIVARQFAYSQLINCNPDPDDDPWYAGGLPEITPEIHEVINAIPALVLTQASQQTELGYFVDNSQLPFMPPIIYQGSQGICAQAAGIGYMFTYEINRLRNIPSNNDSNLYHASFTYNFLNYGLADTGSWTHDGLLIVKEMGCPDMITYDRTFPNPDWTEWMTGYDKYNKAMKNRIESYETIIINDSTGLITLKHWLYDHGCGADTGGLAVFGVLHMWGLNYGLIQQGPETGKSIIDSVCFTSSNDGHAMTFVGYNDSIRYDFNGDEQFTNNIDINGDGIVDMQDWEWGALKVANSWGTLTWPPNTGGGYVYLPYRFLPDTNLLNGDYAYVCYAIADYQQDLIIKAGLTHPVRDKLQIWVGFDSTAGHAEPPPHVIYREKYSTFSTKTGSLPLLGMNNFDTLKIALDYYFWEIDNLGEVFFCPRQLTGLMQNDGMTHSFSLVDYRWNEGFELACDQVPDSILPGMNWLYIDYDLLPFEIASDILLTTDHVCRLSPVVTNFSTLIFYDTIHELGEPELHFYNGNLQIDTNSTLILYPGVKFIAKRGVNYLTLKGDISANQVTFQAEENARFTILLQNLNNSYTFTDCIFNNVKISGFADSLIIDHCNIGGTSIKFKKGNLLVKNNENFTNSVIKAYHPEGETRSVIIRNNQIVNGSTIDENAVITIDHYDKFIIEDNTLEYVKNHGIELFYAGRRSDDDHLIERNYIESTGIFTNKDIGIHSYFSDVIIRDNYIKNNDYGITGFHKSDIRIIGDTLSSINDIQHIIDNYYCQALFSISSYPSEFRYNIIENNNSNSDSIPHV
jgi:hypothetical protein